MKICIASHIVLDEIVDLEGKSTESLGGPVCYGSLLAKAFNCSTITATRAGFDILDKKEILKNCNIFLREDQIDNTKPTTRFRLVLNKDEGRALFLLSKCSEITLHDFTNSDGVILSPVFDEISQDTIRQIVQQEKNRFIMIDPQGFLRHKNKDDQSIQIRKELDLDLNGITGIKTDEEELVALTGGIGSVDGMKILKKKYNLEFAISTGKNSIFFLHKDTLYTITFKKIDSPDHTGLGDILTTGFSCSYLKERDPLWAICFGAGSVIAALQSKKKGVEKIPNQMNLIERQATYFYNTIKFKTVE